MQQKFEVAVNLAQDFTDAQKAQARENIGVDYIARYIITDDDNYVRDMTKHDTTNPLDYKKVTTSELDALPSGTIIMILNSRASWGSIEFFIGTVKNVGGSFYCVGTQSWSVIESIIGLKISKVDNSDPNAFVTATQEVGEPIGNYTYGTLTYVSSNNDIYNNKIIQLNNDAHLTSATLHINSNASINEANHSCIEFDNNYNYSCDIEIIDDATNTKLRYDTDKGYTIPANTFVQITVLGHCWTFKEYTQPS